jgi:hypothetical protein
VPRDILIDYRLISRRHVRLLALDLVACRARQTCATAVAGVGAVASVAPRLIPMILAHPAGAATELAFHTHYIFGSPKEFDRTNFREWSKIG